MFGLVSTGGLASTWHFRRIGDYAGKCFNAPLKIYCTIQSWIYKDGKHYLFNGYSDGGYLTKDSESAQTLHVRLGACVEGRSGDEYLLQPDL